MSQTVRWDRLQKWLDHLPNIPQNQFTMEVYRTELKDRSNKHCGSAGCILGHMTALAEEPLPFNESGIDFTEYALTELNIPSKSHLWRYLFSSDWGAFHPFIYQAQARLTYALQNKENHAEPSDIFWHESFKFHQFKDLTVELINDPANDGMRPTRGIAIGTTGNP